MAAGRLKFQPTRPLRGATPRGQKVWARPLFQPTRPLRGATSGMGWRSKSKGISTHAPLAGRDLCHSCHSRKTARISTHAPLAGRDVDGGAGALGQNISTHAPLAGRDRVPADSQGRCTGISTHAPLAGRDNAHKGCRADQKYFNPRAPCGARRRSGCSPTWRFSHFNPRAPCGARPLITMI